MAEFGNVLKTLTEQKPIVWLASAGPREGETYDWLARPETLRSIKEAGITRVVLDWQDSFDFSDARDRYHNGELKADGLVQAFREDPMRKVVEKYTPHPPSPEVLARLVINARENGIDLAYIGDPMRDHVSGAMLEQEAGYRRALQEENPHGIFSDLAALTRPKEDRQLGLARDIIAEKSGETWARLGSFSDYLTNVAGKIGEQAEQAGGKVLLVHQGVAMPDGRRFDELLGRERVARIDVGQIPEPGPYERFLPCADYEPAPVLDLSTSQVASVQPVPVRPRCIRPAAPGAGGP